MPSTSRTYVPPARIRRAREAAGLKRPAAAALISISPHTLRDWERGRRPAQPGLVDLLEQRLTGETAEAHLRKRLRAAAQHELAIGRGRRASASPGRAQRRTQGARHADVLRLALSSCEPTASLEQLAAWCGFSIHALRSWLSAPPRRAMPRYAIRLALWELSARDRGDTDWRALRRTCD